MVDERLLPIINYVLRANNNGVRDDAQRFRTLYYYIILSSITLTFPRNYAAPVRPNIQIGKIERKHRVNIEN